MERTSLLESFPQKYASFTSFVSSTKRVRAESTSSFHLDSSIPQRYWDYLEIGYFDSNKLSGALPSEALGSLYLLRKSHCSIRIVIIILSRVLIFLHQDELHLHDNEFTGSLPMELGKLKLERKCMEEPAFCMHYRRLVWQLSQEVPCQPNGTYLCLFQVSCIWMAIILQGLSLIAWAIWTVWVSNLKSQEGNTAWSDLLSHNALISLYFRVSLHIQQRSFRILAHHI